MTLYWRGDMKIVVTKLGSPSENGWLDVCNVIDGEELVHSTMCSISPNPFSPRSRQQWWEVYGSLAVGHTYQYEVVQHARFGKSILVNGGQPVASANPNPNHSGEYILTEIFIHEANPGGNSDTWRGSAGCITVPRRAWSQFISQFSVGDRGEIVLR